jgi:hypothetical protein
MLQSAVKIYGIGPKTLSDFSSGSSTIIQEI